MQIVTANRLTDGRVVYLTSADDWHQDAAQACRAEGEDAGARLLQIADVALARQQIVDPYLIDVDDNDAARPTRYREWIRASGPSVETGRVETGRVKTGRVKTDVPLQV